MADPSNINNNLINREEAISIDFTINFEESSTHTNQWMQNTGRELALIESADNKWLLVK